MTQQPAGGFYPDLREKPRPYFDCFGYAQHKFAQGKSLSTSQGGEDVKDLA